MLEISLPSSIEYLPLVDSVCQAFCVWAGASNETTDDISMAVIEASTNAVVHGNKCLRSRKMRAVFEKKHGEIIISVSDEGDGFDPESVPSPVDEENILKESGRGIYIMRHVMDAVDFDRPRDGGTRIRLVKHLAEQEEGRVLCVDYGQKRVGLALSDELCITAQPLGKIEKEGNEDVIAELERIAKEHDVIEIVVGLPLTLKGEVTRGASRVIAFAVGLNKRLCMPVITWDERLSTKQGERVLIESGMRREKRKEVVDSVAAAIILQSYLDARKKK
jgi:putative Holliday junction resolvase